jgi:hypothetical protein
MRSELNANLKGGTMISKTRLLVVALTIAISVPAYAEEKFEKLKAQQIRARVIGKDITDGVHWSEYYRKDGALISVDMVTKRTGIWKVQGDKLCKSEGKNKELACYEVWMSGNSISLRLHEGDTPFVRFVEKHGAN